MNDEHEELVQHIKERIEARSELYTNNTDLLLDIFNLISNEFYGDIE